MDNLRPAARYTFKILLRTAAATDGVRSEAREVVRVPPEAPGAPLHLVAACQWSSTRAKLQWDPPENPNGRITSYIIRYGIPNLSGWDRSKRVEVTEECGHRRTVEIDELRPERRYRITVTGRVEGVQVDGAPASVECELPAGVPFLGNTSRLRTTPATASDQVILEWTEDTFSDYMGTIGEYAVLVGKEGSLDAPRGGKKAVPCQPWTNFSNGDSDFYQATPPGWNPFGRNEGQETGSDPLACEVTTIVESGGNMTVLRCTIGAQSHCPDNQTFCNGPLWPDTGYELKIRGFTRGGYNETQIIFVRTGLPPSPSITGPVATAVIILLLLGALSGGCYALKKKGHLQPLIQSVQSRLTASDTKETSGDPVLEMQRGGNASRFVLTKTFAEHVRMMMSDSHLQFAREFEELKNASPKLQCTVAESDENRAKNRWLNIFPFDHSRVKLLPLCDEPSSDFINANYIPGLSSQREYIATQGPLPHTVDDFWRMVWEQSVTTVVMLTQCVERGKKKCEQYWPEQGDSGYYGDMVVTTVSESMLSSFIIRVFWLKLGSYERQVKQMHFTRWPDFGCPECPEDLINFVNAVRDHMPRISPGPILVHCSAGVGRTGTFIAVDRLSRQIAGGETSVDVYGTVLELRNHRTNMVQTEDQYIYIHLCVCQLIREREQPRPAGDTLYSNTGVEKDTPL